MDLNRLILPLPELIKIYLAYPEYQRYIDNQENLINLSYRFGVNYPITSITEISSVIPMIKDLTYHIDDSMELMDIDKLVHQTYIKITANPYDSSDSDIESSDEGYLIKRIGDKRLDRPGPGWVFWYFGFIDSTSPYFRAMIGEIPLTPELFEVLVTSKNIEAGHETLRRVGIHMNDKDDYIINSNGNTMGTYDMHNKSLYYAHNISPCGWTKTQLKNAILEYSRDNNFNLDISIITNNPDDIVYKLPGFTESHVNRPNKIYYEALYRKLHNTQNIPLNWELMMRHRVLPKLEMETLVGNMQYDIATRMLAKRYNIYYTLEEIMGIDHQEIKRFLGHTTGSEQMDRVSASNILYQDNLLEFDDNNLLYDISPILLLSDQDLKRKAQKIYKGKWHQDITRLFAAYSVLTKEYITDIEQLGKLKIFIFYNYSMSLMNLLESAFKTIYNEMDRYPDEH